MSETVHRCLCIKTGNILIFKSADLFIFRIENI